MRSKIKLADGEAARTAAVTVPLRCAISDAGELVSASVLAQRIGWLADLTSGMATALITEHWNATDASALAAGKDLKGEPLPSNAYVALRRLGWGVMTPAGVRVYDRVVRMAQEQAGRLLRSAQWRADVLTGILVTWPIEPLKRTSVEWDAVRNATPDGKYLPTSIIKARTKQIVAFEQKYGHLPVDLYELESAPSAASLLLLSACDKQLVVIERHETDLHKAVLRVRLPIRPDPRSYDDWFWISIPLALPVTIPANAALHLPTLRVVGNKILANLTFTYPVPKVARTGHTVALGCDWGLNTLLSAGAVRLNADGTITQLGAGAMFRANGVLAKQHRLRRLGEKLHRKITVYKELDISRHKSEILIRENQFVSTRRSNLNDALACAAARWTVDQAIAINATVIYVEDLRSMEARGMGKNMNTRLSQTVRSEIVRWMRHIASEVGIAVVTVPAKNTSKHCPRCLVPLRHRKSSDRPTVPGWSWAICNFCGWQGDRDVGAWQRIAARGLTHQIKTIEDRASKTLVIRSVDDAFEARAVVLPKTPSQDRSKVGPTRRRTSRLTPRRRQSPSPSSHGDGQRPEGRTHTVRQLPRAAMRSQGTSTIIKHHPGGAALGAGFHFHVHATSPRWADPPQDTRSYYGSLR